MLGKQYPEIIPVLIAELFWYNAFLESCGGRPCLRWWEYLADWQWIWEIWLLGGGEDLVGVLSLQRKKVNWKEQIHQLWVKWPSYQGCRKRHGLLAAKEFVRSMAALVMWATGWTQPTIPSNIPRYLQNPATFVGRAVLSPPRWRRDTPLYQILQVPLHHVV